MSVDGNLFGFYVHVCVGEHECVGVCVCMHACICRSEVILVVAPLV